MGGQQKRTAYRLSKDGIGRSFSRVPHLLQYVRSGSDFARIKVEGKIMREGLEAPFVQKTEKLVKLFDFPADTPLKMRNRAIHRRVGHSGFTLIEVAVAAAITALVMAGMFKGYNMVGRRAQFSACNLAANATAMQHLEQVIGASWVPAYGVVQLFSTNLTAPQTCNLCLPSAQSNVITCTNFTTVTQISTNPTYAMIRVQCVWTMPSYGGLFTNTVAVLRAPNL